MTLSLPPHLESLLENARAGSSDALGALFEQFRPFLYVLARNAQRSRLRAKYDESDLVQDTYTAAYEEFRQFRGRTPQELLAWLQRILERLSLNRINYFQQIKRDVGRELSLDGPHFEHAGGTTPDPRNETPSKAAMRKERIEVARRALLSLPARYRVIIELHLLENRNFDSIANLLDLSTDAVRKRWRRGLLLWREAVVTSLHGLTSD
jgi:RNA polymerase sigma-70 factor (ECF subfamily)